MKNFPREQVALIKDRADIVSIIERNVGPLKKSGAKFKVNCPFCDDKKARFEVCEKFKSFKCWKCKEGGDVFTFIMKTEGIKFPEAVEHVANIVGVTL